MHRHWLKNTILVAGLSALCHTAAATEFRFDDGTETAQGWERRLLISDGTTVVPRGPAGWQDNIDYPTAGGAPLGDGLGSAFTPGGAAPGDDADGNPLFKVVQFLSPDLSGDPMWQNLQSYSGQMIVPFAGIGDFFSNTFLTIEDTTGGGSTLRTFV